MTDCECHRETGNHELCCGHLEGRNPDCPRHGDRSPSSVLAVLAVLDGTTAGAVSVLTGLSRAELDDLGGFGDESGA